MSQELIIDLTREALFLIIQVSAPILLIALIVGLTVSIFQTVTSIQEPTLAFAPKIIAVFIGLILAGPWMLTVLKEFMIKLFSTFSQYIIG